MIDKSVDSWNQDSYYVKALGIRKRVKNKK